MVEYIISDGKTVDENVTTAADGDASASQAIDKGSDTLEEESELIVQSLDDLIIAPSDAVDTKEEKETKEESNSTKVQGTEEGDAKSETVETEISEVVDQFKALKATEDSKQANRRAISEDSYLTSDITFNDPSLQLPQCLRDALIIEMKFDRPTRIQRYALPIVLQGRNLIAQAQTSAGKTVCFVIAMLNRIDTSQRCLQAICLTPTRELANQILSDAVIPLSKYMPDLQVAAALKGSPEHNISNAHLIVGTPGTVSLWLQRRYIELRHVKTFVLDEADEMVNVKAQGSATLQIKQNLPYNCQVLLFSATYTTEILAYARRIVEHATVITLAPPSQSSAAQDLDRGGGGGRGRGRGRGGRGGEEGAPQMVGAESLVLDVIKQVWIDTMRIEGGKERVLKDIYSFLTIQQSIVFVATKASANEVARVMTSSGFEVSTLHSELEGYQRDEVMAKFRSGESKVLITTNVLARGVDVPSVAVVVNYDIPTTRRGTGRYAEIIPDHATYLHRIGRTGRFNRAGTAITFVHGGRDLDMLREIERTYAPGKELIMQWDGARVEELGEEQLSRMDKFESS